MALKAVVTDLSRPNPYAILVHFEIRDAGTNALVLGPATHGFNIVKYDANGAVIAETATQRRARLKAEFDAYADTLMVSIGMVDAGFADLEAWAVGYVRSQP